MFRRAVSLLALAACANAFSVEHEEHAKTSKPRPWAPEVQVKKGQGPGAPHWSPAMMKVIKTSGMPKDVALEHLKNAQMKRKADQDLFNTKVKEETETREARKLLREERLEAMKQRSNNKKARVKEQMAARKKMQREKEALRTPLGEKRIREIKTPDAAIDKYEYAEMKKEAKRLLAARKEGTITMDEFKSRMRELKDMNPGAVNYRETKAIKNDGTRESREDEIMSNMDYAKQMKTVADLEHMAKAGGEDAEKAAAKMRMHLSSMRRFNARDANGKRVSKEVMKDIAKDVPVKEVSAMLRKEVRRMALNRA